MRKSGIQIGIIGGQTRLFKLKYAFFTFPPGGPARGDLLLASFDELQQRDLALIGPGAGPDGDRLTQHLFFPHDQHIRHLLQGREANLCPDLVRAEVLFDAQAGFFYRLHNLPGVSVELFADG